MSLPSQCNLLMNFVDIFIKVQNTQYKLSRQILVSQSDNLQIHNNTNLILPLPQWVTKQIYQLLQTYLKTKDVTFLFNHIHNNNTIIKLLRTSDFLGLNKFHQTFITKVIIPSLNQQNSIVLLEQTQKKLKNLENGAQCWFSLLNHSINYVATHIFQIFKQDPTKLKKINEKILSEVLDRAIRIQKKNNYQAKHLLFQLILHTKGLQKVSDLCKSQRQTILQKKINAKIHAKLSWKLQNIANITEKKTKDFKFLDLDWYLSAVRDVETKQLKISLNLLNKNKKQKEYDFTKIGVFYTKLIRSADGHTQQSGIQINYVSFEEPQSIIFLKINKEYQKQLEGKKLELNIYCSLEQIYTFAMNYILQNFQKYQQYIKYFSKEELFAFVVQLKKLKKYNQVMKIANQMIKSDFKDSLTLNQAMTLFSSFPKDSLSLSDQMTLKQFIAKLKLQNNFNYQFNGEVDKDIKNKIETGFATPQNSGHQKNNQNRISADYANSNSNQKIFKVYSERQSQTSIHDSQISQKFRKQEKNKLKNNQMFGKKQNFQFRLENNSQYNQSNIGSSKPSIYEIDSKSQNFQFNFSNNIQKIQQFSQSKKSDYQQNESTNIFNKLNYNQYQSSQKNQKYGSTFNQNNQLFARNSNDGSNVSPFNYGNSARFTDQKSCQLKRSDSRTRTRKIFDQSPLKSGYKITSFNFNNPKDIQAKKQEILKLTDIKNYFYNKQCHLAKALAF